MHISARVDYGVQALLHLTRAQREAGLSGTDAYMSTHEIAEHAGISVKFLEGIMADLRRSGLVQSRRGAVGGFSLTRSADEISLADIVRCLDGPLAAVRGSAPENQKYSEPASRLTDVWVALRSAMRNVLEDCTLAQVESGALPESLNDLLRQDGAWRRR